MPLERYILALADDMTGALEVGAKFRSAGISSLISAKPDANVSAPVVVFDTESRHCSPEAAYSLVRRYVLTGAGQPRLVYKKTDSTLRGNIAAELRALADLFPDWRIGYAPAYPALGRTVKDGILYVDDIPLAQTAFAHDALNPVRDSSVSAGLDPSLPCTIFDGVTDADMADTARMILGNKNMRIACGSAGLAEALARQIDAPRSPTPSLPSVRRCLVLNGSRHDRSNEQVAYAQAQGCISPDQDSSWRLLWTPIPPGTSAVDASKINGDYVLTQLAAHDPDALLVIGGDTTFAIVAALGLPTLIPIGEVLPGISVATIEAAHLHGRTHDLLLITKAGGFGSRDVICQVRMRLESKRT